MSDLKEVRRLPVFGLRVTKGYWKASTGLAAMNTSRSINRQMDSLTWCPIWMNKTFTRHNLIYCSEDCGNGDYWSCVSNIFTCPQTHRRSILFDCWTGVICLYNLSTLWSVGTNYKFIRANLFKDIMYYLFHATSLLLYHELNKWVGKYKPTYLHID